MLRNSGSCGNSRGRNNHGKRRLRMEHLEPRLVLSTSVHGQAARAVAAATTVVSLSPTADAYVSSSTPTTNYGQTTDLLLQTTTARNGASEANTYLKFDLSDVSSTMTKAVLNLTALSVSSGTSSVTIRIQLLSDGNDSWVEGIGGTNSSSTGAITWRNSASGFGQTITLTLSAAQLSASKTISVDVTKLINQRFNTNGIASFLISVVPSFGRMARSSTTSIAFASDENSTVSYRPTLSVTTTATNPAPTVAQQPTVVSQTSTTATLSVLGADSTNGESGLTYTWSLTSSPSGATTPSFSSNGTNASKNTTVTFSAAGTYVFTVKITDPSDGLSVTTNTVTVTVSQTLTSLAISPASATVSLSSTQQLTASGLDQFGNSMSLSGTVTWSASQGTFSGGNTGATVTYVAPSVATSDTVTATLGSLTASAAMTVVASNYLGLTNADLAALTQSLDADGTISRADMVQILYCIESESDGVVDSADLSDLKAILKNSSTLNIVSYVLVLANDVVNGSTANATYQSTTLGNLAAGDSNSKLEKLINKWFYGTDLPTTSYSYDTATSGTLYGSSGASHTDEKQGDLGDCYLIAALGSIADSSQSAISSMLIDNGDGTYTVRFYYNGVADYVTVNTQLPVDSNGNLVYDGYGTSSTSSSNVLWLELIEKAYAQWNETGKTGRDSTSNSYAAIEGGWMGDVYAQVLNCADTAYSLNSSTKQTLINALSSGKAVTIGTVSSPASSTGLYGNHAYNVLSYNSSTGLFTLYNPWGSYQPSTLTWSQLVANCDGFAVGDTSTTTASSRFLAINTVVSPRIAAQLQTTVDTTQTVATSDAVAVQPTQAAQRKASAIDYLLSNNTTSADRLFDTGPAVSMTSGRQSASDATVAADEFFSSEIDQLLVAV
ncbi:MAG: C2 family cysteine protease [Thermoguttaceae bacterium]